MVLLPQVQQLRQRPTSAQSGVEECNFFLEGNRPQLIAEIEAVQRVLEHTHRIPGRVGEHRERGSAEQGQACQSEKCFEHEVSEAPPDLYPCRLRLHDVFRCRTAISIPQPPEAF
jgi:hypothetical protein